MLKKPVILLTVFLLMFLSDNSYSQMLLVRESYLPESTYYLNYTRKITFLSGNVLIHQHGENVSEHKLSNITNIGFESLLTESLRPQVKASRLIAKPNPTDGLLSIELDNLASEEGILEILNNYGLMVFSVNVSPIGSGKYVFDMSSLSQGIYHVCFSTSRKKVSTRVIRL